MLSHRLDLKHSANLRVSPGAVTSMAWTSDGYALAVGYEHAWAVWTVGGRLNAWGMALAEGDGRGRGGEGFLHGVLDLVRVESPFSARDVLHEGRVSSQVLNG